VDDQATIDWGRVTKLRVEMKNILPSSLGEIDGGGGGCGGESGAGFCVARERRGAQAIFLGSITLKRPVLHPASMESEF
jgi:hypothetical protein